MSKSYKPAVIAPRGGFPPRPPVPPRPALRTRSVSMPAVVVLLIAGVIVGIMQARWIGHNREKFDGSSVNRLFGSFRKTEHVPIQCPQCRGRGLVPDPGAAGPEMLCPTCLGVGCHFVRLTEGDYLCPACDGMGRVAGPGDAVGVCDVCDGRGLLPGVMVKGQHGQPARILQVECEHCVGDGHLRVPGTGRTAMCPVCFGRGYNWVRKSEQRPDLCPACGGMGRVANTDKGIARTCERCQGWGLTTRSAAADPETPAP